MSTKKTTVKDTKTAITSDLIVKVGDMLLQANRDYHKKLHDIPLPAFLAFLELSSEGKITCTSYDETAYVSGFLKTTAKEKLKSHGFEYDKMLKAWKKPESLSQQAAVFEADEIAKIKALAASL